MTDATTIPTTEAVELDSYAYDYEAAIWALRQAERHCRAAIARLSHIDTLELCDAIVAEVEDRAHAERMAARCNAWAARRAIRVGEWFSLSQVGGVR